MAETSAISSDAPQPWQHARKGTMVRKKKETKLVLLATYNRKFTYFMQG
jgi:hypothetical protein